jgi:hypothetical protein
VPGAVVLKHTRPVMLGAVFTTQLMHNLLVYFVYDTRLADPPVKVCPVTSGCAVNATLQVKLAYTELLPPAATCCCSF